MKLGSVSGVVCYVKDIHKTANFYESIGFIVTKKTEDQLTIRLNWFWLDFHQIDSETKSEFISEAQAVPKGAGQYLYISVDDVDACYKQFMDKGLQPSSEPKDWPWGNREFVIRDPDGYKLVFFKKQK